ncbi:MAG: hypothetical protein IKF79_01375 [Methanosphaera sp.]|nr:hypothetical protein [Methanosphaera sp.]
MTEKRLYSDEANNGGGKSLFLFSRTLKKEELSSIGQQWCYCGLCGKM